MYILFDIGGTNIRVSTSNDGSSIEGFVRHDTPQDDPEKGVALIRDAAASLLKDTKRIAAAGGVPGAMDPDKTTILTSPNLPGWKGFPLKQKLEEALSVPAYLENDTSMVGLGEAVFGAGKGKDIVVYLTVSTGVGGSKIVKGSIADNTLGFEPGHQIIDLQGPECGCGGYGHLEAFIGGGQMEKQYNMPPKDINDPTVWEKAAKHLAIGINNVIMFWSPDILILGGSMMKDIDLEDVQKHVRELVTIHPTIPDIRMFELGDRAGLHGSLAYLTKRHV